MRLTLRTLLAYLDDVLEPSEAKEIGRKLQESPVATALVSRLREVMRRRRIGALELVGPGAGIDPNLVAQYLDNTLPADQVPDLEKVCLESDLQLAEVAACHQILTLALSDPVEISAASRERIYVLGPVEAADKLHAGSDGVHRANGVPPAPAAVRTAPGSAGQSFEETLPEYLRAKPWSGRFVAAAVVLLLGAVWIGAFLSDQGTREILSSVPKQLQKAAPVEPVEPAEPEVDETVAKIDAAKPEPPKPNAPPDAAKPSTVDIPPEAVAVKPEDMPADAWIVATIMSKPAAAAPPAPEPMPPEPAAPKHPPVTATYASAEGVLLQQNPGDPNWYVVPRKAALKPGARLACPEPFEAVLEFTRGAVRVMLLGDTQVELGKANDAAPLTLRLIQGRMLLTTAKTADDAWPLGFAIGNRAGVMEFGEGELLCGIELLMQEPVGFEQPVATTLESEGMYVVAGSVKWMADGSEARLANRGVYLSLLTDQPPLNFGSPISTVPDWIDPQRRKAESSLRRFAKAFEKEFEASRPVDSDLRALIRDPRPKISELAVRSLALTDNYAAVVQALAQAPQEDARKAAMTGVRKWLGVSANRGPLLKQALAMYYERDDHKNALYRLLWGISVDEAKQESPSYEILEWLRSDKLEIRELTFANLVRLTGRKYGYSPLATAGQREPAVKRWFEHVTKEQGILAPE